MLELAVLGILSESPMHGYELRKRLAAVLGAFHRFSYGSLYPLLRKLQAEGFVTADDAGAAARIGGRSRVVYTLTAEGKERLTELLGEGGPASWEDEMFGVRFAFFGKTDAAVRLRILEGRRTRLEERREKVRSALSRTRERFDAYTLELQRHGLESVEREVRWLTELIETERAHGQPGMADLGLPEPAPQPQAAVRPAAVRPLVPPTAPSATSQDPDGEVPGPR
ncbi:PadR family transcriptional regulator [Frankia sp. AgB1.9]|uniref:PadR family transcriptional regulator n=1 Tax=unclassified Frankia TaxID=2632575 RepID=UPI0019344C43|nr:MULTISPECIES: PadR family transcriptional regulator [unclassified Frankia]MBL7494037.1 PadR family transcriptional regulator [Frankia sp. AgW1.1]MBL7547517.1 PadR family transcriptional regulator [Frankia sp. AgB1.9]MBL7619027.1 PadR family transcriptional regulator [Frankia sp. AgB1.8]